ncbi:hypothetical protein BH24ACT4_BH24ACT4_10070 [soil metagenome]
MGPVRRRRHQLLAALTGGVVLVLLGAVPAAADAPGPTDYRSEVTVVEPAAPGLVAEVLGGDGFLAITVEEGHTVEVPGYSGEPYLRVQADGTVQENQESAATVLNQSRDGTKVTRTFDPEAEPRWETVATDGRWAWHDHRIHYMGQGTPAGATTPDGVAWEVPLTVDGTDTLVEGRYRLLDGPSPLPWLAGAVLLAAVVVGLARLLDPVTAGGLAVLVAGGAGVAAGVAQRAADPPGVSTSPLIVVLPAIAVVAGVIAVMQRDRVLRAVAVLAGAAAAGGWALIRLPVLWNAELPTSLPAPADRAATAVALGSAVGAAVVAVRSGALSPPPGEAAPPPRDPADAA